MGWLRTIILGLLGTFGAELRFPVLFFLALVLLVFNIALPDPLPFLDELILALMTAMIAAWKRPSLPPSEDPSEPIDVTARVERVDPPEVDR